MAIRNDAQPALDQLKILRTDCGPGRATNRGMMKIHNADIRLITDDIIFFDEIGTGITYDVEKFIQELKKFINIGTRRVICRDDTGTYDEMIFEFGDFYRFEVLRDNDPIISIINDYLEGQI